MRTPYSAAVLALFISATACVAQPTIQLPIEDRPLGVRIEPLFAVGGVDATDWAAFDALNRVVFDRDGDLYILDERNQRVVVVGPGGDLVREVGRRGQGPAEFVAPRDLALTGTGELVILDVVQRRLSRFAPDGSLLGVVPSTLGVGAPRRIFGHPGGVVGDVHILVAGDVPVARTGEGLQPVSGRPIQHYALADRGGATVLHEARLNLPPTDVLTRFFPEFHLTGLPDGSLAFVDSGAYEITLLHAAGGPRAVLRRRLPSRAVTAQDREAERERLLRELSEGRAPESTVTFGGQPPSRQEMDARHRARIANMGFPDEFPQITGIIADGEGRLWVERMGERPHQAGPIDIIDPTGRYLGTLEAGSVELPVAFGPAGIAAWLERDELDVPVVRVARLRLAAP